MNEQDVKMKSQNYEYKFSVKITVQYIFESSKFNKRIKNQFSKIQSNNRIKLESILDSVIESYVIPFYGLNYKYDEDHDEYMHYSIDDMTIKTSKIGKNEYALKGADWTKEDWIYLIFRYENEGGTSDNKN